jgi:acetate kinase
MKVLVLNCGSSSLRFQVIEVAAGVARGGKEDKLARGLVDRIGGKAACHFSVAGSSPQVEEVTVRNHGQAVRKVFEWLSNRDPEIGFEAVGHRVVHGGDRFTTSVLIDGEVITAIEGFNDLAPLHNPACLSGIRAAQAVLGPSVPMAAVFDTSFHCTIPDYASTYAIPHELSRRHRIRRLGVRYPERQVDRYINGVHAS